MKMVHVASEAKASPIMTALTRISADMNIDQGDSSRGVVGAGFSALLPASAEAGVASVAAGACAGDAIWAGPVGICCCADDGDTSDSIASTTIQQIARKGEGFIFRSNSGSDCEYASGRIKLVR